MVKRDMEEIVLAKFKNTSRSGRYKEYYKLGIRGSFLFLIDDDNSQPLDSLETINYSDVSCIYCIENGETKNVPADIFFRIYSDYLGSGIRNVNRE